MVKKLLDRLVARQTQLMSRLSEPATVGQEAEINVQGKVAPAGPAELEAQVRAADEARASLKRGEVSAAKALLRPFATGAAVVDVAVLLGGLALEEGLLQEALLHARQAEALDSQDRAVVSLLAACHESTGNAFDEVRYRRMLVHTRNPPHAADVVRLARALTRAASKSNRVSPAVKEIKGLEATLAACSDAQVSDRMVFAELLFQFSETRSHACSLRSTIDAPGPGEKDAIAVWVRLVDHCRKHARPLQRLTDAGIPKRRPYVAELRNVYVDPALQWIPILEQATVISSDHAARRLVTRSDEPTSRMLMSSQRKALLRTQADARVIAEPALLLGGSSDYYLHNVDFLGSLAVAEAFSVDKSLKLIVNDDIAAFQMQQFRHLGVGEHQLIRVAVGQAIVLQDALVPSRASLGDQWVDPLVVEWHRRRLGRQGSDSPGSRLYLRQPETTPSGHLVNEPEVETALRSLGFDSVCFDASRSEDLVSRFADATCIIGRPNPAFANMVYAPAGATVIVLVNRRDAALQQDIPYSALAAACGHRLLGVPTDIAAPGQDRPTSRGALRMDVASLSRSVEDVLA